MDHKSPNFPSIFNDVIGPVMRGPSSSHCAASVRIGRLARDLMGGSIFDVTIEFDPDGSLATTHESQGSDMGLFGGLLGWDATDERLPASAQAIRDAGIRIRFRITPYGAAHPNTYKLTMHGGDGRHTMTAISTGGGMIEVIEIDGAPVSFAGDNYLTLIFANDQLEEIREFIASQFTADRVDIYRGKKGGFVAVSAREFPSQDLFFHLSMIFPINEVRKLAPVMPVLSRKDLQVPFITCAEMLEYNASRDLPLWELARHYESARGGISQDAVFDKMQSIVRIMQTSIQEGLAGTDYADRILGCQSRGFLEKMEQRRLLDGGMLNSMILYVSAIMEVKSSMGVIVAAPTAGSCGALPGAVLAASQSMTVSEDDLVKAMLAAGMIGIFIAAHATFAAEVGGCQAECGSGSGMAAAALVTLAGGSLTEALNASSLALQSTLGMICDPIANRVEAPCLSRNVLAATNALACANMALAGYDPLIPLDEVIDTMDRVGKAMPCEVRCTALGGLSITPTSKAIEQRLSDAKTCGAEGCGCGKTHRAKKEHTEIERG